MIKFLFLIVCLVALISQFEASDNLNKATEGVKNAADKTARRLNSVNDRAAQGVGILADGIKVRVERFQSRPVVQAAGQGLIGSVVRGAGRLIRNVTVEAGRAAGTVVGGVYNLGKHTGGAVVDTIRSGARKIRSGIAVPTTQTPAPKGPSASDATAPAELNNVEAQKSNSE